MSIDIEFPHPEYSIRLPEWHTCYDCYVGEGAIKNKTTVYLPKLERHDDTIDGKARYADYLHRATFFGVVSTVITGRVGQVMRIPLQGNFTPVMEEWTATIMRDKSNLTELTKRVLTEVLTTGRVGLLLDRSEDGGDPYVALYRAHDIVNWNTVEDRLTRVVIKENTIVQKEQTGKTIQMIEPRYRELRLNDSNLYEVAIYTLVKGQYVQTDLLEPVNSGQRIDMIPFQFINADSISVDTSKPPLLDLAALNISHYRNSADYEQLLHRVGVAATFFSAGITEDEANDPANLSVGADVRWFSSNPNAKFGILEFSGNSATAMERAMLEKTQMMATIGGQLVQRHRKQVETAETARLRSASENSVLDTIVSTVEIGLNQLLELSAIWLNQAGEIGLTLNRDYLDDRWSPEELKAVNEADVMGLISKQTAFQMRQKMEVYPENWTFDEEVQLLSNQGVE